MSQSYVVRVQELASYFPANHTGTINCRVIGRETVGAALLEVLIGTITKGHGALKHAHPGLEQASLILEGEGTGEIHDVERCLGPGQWSFNPQGEFHRFSVSSDEPVRVLVIYAPPYSENPDASVLFDEAADASNEAAVAAPIAPLQTRPVHVPPFCRPVIDANTHGARHMAVYACHMAPGEQACQQRIMNVEQVLFVKEGALSGMVGDVPYQARAGDFVFIPEGMSHQYQATADMRAFLIYAFGQ